MEEVVAHAAAPNVLSREILRDLVGSCRTVDEFEQHVDNFHVAELNGGAKKRRIFVVDVAQNYRQRVILRERKQVP
jgi:hypothetical protein